MEIYHCNRKCKIAGELISTSHTKKIQEAYVLSYRHIAILLDLDCQYSYENIMRKGWLNKL